MVDAQAEQAGGDLEAEAPGSGDARRARALRELLRRVPEAQSLDEAPVELCHGHLPARIRDVGRWCRRCCRRRRRAGGRRGAGGRTGRRCACRAGVGPSRRVRLRRQLLLQADAKICERLPREGGIGTKLAHALRVHELVCHDGGDLRSRPVGEATGSAGCRGSSDGGHGNDGRDCDEALTHVPVIDRRRAGHYPLFGDTSSDHAGARRGGAGSDPRGAGRRGNGAADGLLLGRRAPTGPRREGRRAVTEASRRPFPRHVGGVHPLRRGSRR